eukprot:s610_g3.t1
MAATSLADSTAAFQKQASNLGLDDEWIQGLKRMGIKNLGGMAFACGQPGAPVAENDVRTLLGQAVPSKAITVGDVVIMKRLIFESQTSMVALSRAQADPAADPSTRKMPTAERTSRLAAQKLRLTGLDLQGSMEVAHCVYDLINGMLETDALKYVAPAKCITRMQEITSARPPKELKLDASGSGILVKDSQSEQTCSVGAGRHGSHDNLSKVGAMPVSDDAAACTSRLQVSVHHAAAQGGSPGICENAGIDQRGH